MKKEGRVVHMCQHTIIIFGLTVMMNGSWKAFPFMPSYVRWSSGMSHMLGILISRYIQLCYSIPFVSYCFQLDKIACIFGTLSPILMGFSAKQSSLTVLPNRLRNWNLIGPDIRLISLDHITYAHSLFKSVVAFIIDLSWNKKSL